MVEKKQMTKEQVIAKVGRMPNIYQQILRVKDKQGRKWIVVRTVTEQWYAKAYFDKVMSASQEEPKVTREKLKDDW